jgi:hypothetical protein
MQKFRLFQSKAPVILSVDKVKKNSSNDAFHDREEKFLKQLFDYLAETRQTGVAGKLRRCHQQRSSDYSGLDHSNKSSYGFGKPRQGF